MPVVVLQNSDPSLIFVFFLCFIEECGNQKAEGYGGHDKTQEKDKDEGRVAVLEDNYRHNLQYNCEASLVTMEVVSQENKGVK